MGARIAGLWQGLSTRRKALVVVAVVVVLAALGASGGRSPSSAVATLPTTAPLSSGAIATPEQSLLSILAIPTAGGTLLIQSPSDGAVVDTSSVLVSGTAPAGSDVTQDISFGLDQHTVADGSGTWSMTVGLVVGANTLTFRLGDDTSTAVSVTVTFTAAVEATPTPVPPTATPVPPSATPPPALAFNPIKLSGTGTKIVRFKIPVDQAAIAVITETGTSNFVVWTIDSSGAENDLLVNEIGSYTGTRLFDMESDVHSVAFKVESNGRWTITVRPISQAKLWTAATSVSGKGDMVLRVDPPISGFAASTISHKGSSNFVVWAYGDDGSDLLVNEIGSYKGDALWPSGTFLVEIEADGTWAITAPQ